ncbi:hypothetical protein ES703_67355 [subsurface metagenome]
MKVNKIKTLINLIFLFGTDFLLFIIKKEEKMKRLIVTIIILLLGIVTLSAEEVELKGKVVEVIEIAEDDGEVNILRAQIRTQNREMVMTHLGPVWLLDEDLEEGEEITIRGKYREDNQFMVREMIRNTIRYQLRGEDYEPLWLRTRLREENHFYNPLNEGKRKGKIEEIYIDEKSKMMEAKIREDNGELVRVRLAPEWYLKNRIRLGDELEIRGCEVKPDGEIMLLVREMRNLRTRKEIALRNREGFPEWRGKEEGRDPHGREQGRMGKKEGRGKE